MVPMMAFDPLRVKLASALPVVGLIVEDPVTRKSLMDDIASAAFEVETPDASRVHVVSIDAALFAVVNAWQAAEDARPELQVPVRNVTVRNGV